MRRPMRVIDFTTDANPLGPSGKAKSAMRKAVKQIGLYPERETAHLRQYLARREGVAPEQILLGHGSSHLLGLVCWTLRPARVAAAGPTTGALPFYAERCGFHVDVVPPVGEGPTVRPDQQRLSDALLSAQILVVTNPDRFTGSVADPGFLIDLANAAAGGKMLVVDERLAEYGADARTSVPLGPNAVVLRTFSTFHALAGVRLGYAIGDPSQLSRLYPFTELFPLNGLAPAAALASLKDKGFRRRTAAFLQEEKEYVTKKLSSEQAVTICKTACNAVLLALALSPDAVRARFMEQRILAETWPTGSGGTFIRMPLGKHKDNARFLRVLTWIASPAS